MLDVNQLRPQDLQGLDAEVATKIVTLMLHGRTVQVFQPSLTDLQRQLLALLGVPPAAYTCAATHHG